LRAEESARASYSISENALAEEWEVENEKMSKAEQADRRDWYGNSQSDRLHESVPLMTNLELQVLAAVGEHLTTAPHLYEQSSGNPQGPDRRCHCAPSGASPSRNA